MTIQNETDRDAVERLYRQNYKTMMYIAIGILKDQSKAEDAVSQAFLRIIDKLQKFSFEDCNKTRGLIGILVKDICYDMLRADARQRPVDLEEFDLPSGSEDFPYESLLSAENYKTLVEALSGLNEKSSHILKLKYVYEYSDDEIARLLNISKENVRVRVHRAKTALLRALKEGGNRHE
ncbi:MULTISPECIES: RNA polymerase sigma factor [Acutalibacteraceae]|uniref:RNA polymerase sigma factor n=1 Tax=Acutalibacteraceae TaxID=3082771 RepID=UPI001FAAEE37|nr:MULTISPECIES: sigma-70 family RNA polymerase sigma factor [Acutalibacteraceae]